MRYKLILITLITLLFYGCRSYIPATEENISKILEQDKYQIIFNTYQGNIAGGTYKPTSIYALVIDKSKIPNTITIYDNEVEIKRDLEPISLLLIKEFLEKCLEYNDPSKQTFGTCSADYDYELNYKSQWIKLTPNASRQCEIIERKILCENGFASILRNINDTSNFCYFIDSLYHVFRK